MESMFSVWVTCNLQNYCLWVRLEVAFPSKLTCELAELTRVLAFAHVDPACGQLTDVTTSSLPYATSLLVEGNGDDWPIFSSRTLGEGRLDLWPSDGPPHTVSDFCFVPKHQTQSR